MANPSFSVGIEFVTGSFTDVTSDVLRCRVERQLGTLYRPLVDGTALIELANFNGRYSPANADGALFGKMLPNKRVQVNASYAGNSYALFSGWTRSFETNPQKGAQTTIVQAQDVMAKLNNVIITTSLFQQYNPSSLFAVVMSACRVNSFSADTIVGDAIDYAWFTNQDAKTCLQRIINFGRYGVYQDGAGTVNLKNRYAASFNAPVASLVNAFFGLTYALDDSLVINNVKVTGTPRQIVSGVSTVAWLSQTPTIAASSTISFWLTYVNPGIPTMNTPASSLYSVSSADYRANTNSAGTGTDATATLSASMTYYGETAVCSLFNGSGNTVYVTKFQLNGLSAQQQPDVSYATNSTSSQNAYGDHALQLDDDFISKAGYVRPYGDSLLIERKEVLPTISVMLKNTYPEQLAIDVSNTIVVVESLSGVSSNFIVNRLQHQIDTQRGLEHVTTYDVETFIDPSYLVLNDAGKGLLDSTRVLAF